ncbi:MAG: threonylcarbamoyl-AMP synthase [Bacilli bacterium]|jgi:L-threonylcarbamoyladenylate synthase|nr:threonylcarbamoyl-AMP synthase [Bacilli bacterium]
MEKVTLKELLCLEKEDLKGKLICFPTDTVYGVAAIASDIEAVEKIYAMKKRSERKPLALLCSSIKQVEEYVENIDEAVLFLMKKYWPGALTIIFNKKPGVGDHLAKETIAFRMPNSKIALAIINHFSIMATTSVNISGEVEINDIEEIAEKFGDWIDYIVTDEAYISNVPSTVLDATGKSLNIVREGNIKV